MNKSLKAVFTAAMVSLAACSDGALEPVASDVRPLMDLAQAGPSYMSNYVAMGTSLSMGWASDGVHSESQATSWPVQLAKRLHAPFTFPAIDLPGCKPPYAAPLSTFARIDGTSLLIQPEPPAFCAQNRDGVVLPTNNLAVEGSTAGEALYRNESPNNGRAGVTSRVLLPGMTQVSTMKALKPSLVSVEFSGNELLQAQGGVVLEGVTVTPFKTFQSNYAGIIAAVEETGAKALLVSLGTNLENFPAIRTGAELAAQRSAFAAYNVAVAEDCDASPNHLFVRGIVPVAVATGVGRARAGLGPYTISCVDRPFTRDYILSPNDIAAVNALAARMTAEVEGIAADKGYASFRLGVLYEISKRGVPFDLEAFLHSDHPYGELISLDGVHPSAKGQAVLARAAAKAIRQTYGQIDEEIEQN